RLRSPEEIAAAHAAAVEAREKLEALRDAQVAVKIEEDRPAAEMLEAQSKVAEAFEEVVQHIDAAGDAARAASPRTRDHVNNVQRRMHHAESEGRLALLPEDLQQGDIARARQTRDRLVDGWNQGIQSLRELEGRLDEDRKQAAALAERKPAAVSD